MMPLGSSRAMPFVVPMNGKSSPSCLLDADHRPDDLHLRSMAAVTGYHVHAIDGEIGHAADFLVDDTSWRIRYIIVDSRL